MTKSGSSVADRTIFNCSLSQVLVLWTRNNLDYCLDLKIHLNCTITFNLTGSLASKLNISDICFYILIPNFDWFLKTRTSASSTSSPTTTTPLTPSTPSTSAGSAASTLKDRPDKVSERRNWKGFAGALDLCGEVYCTLDNECDSCHSWAY